MTQPTETPVDLEQVIATAQATIKEAVAKNDWDGVYRATEEIKTVRVQVAKLVQEKIVGERARVGSLISKEITPIFEKHAAEIIELGGVARVMFDAGQVPHLCVTNIGEKPASATSKGATTANRMSTSEQYGVSLGAVFERYANAQERAEHDALPTGENTKRWNIKKRVRDRAVKDRLLNHVDRA